ITFLCIFCECNVKCYHKHCSSVTRHEAFYFEGRSHPSSEVFAVTPGLTLPLQPTEMAVTARRAA
ncbi:hypothetical protein XENORESO_001905, partial [Xenotaenia resolanae]